MPSTAQANSSHSMKVDVSNSGSTEKDASEPQSDSDDDLEVLQMSPTGRKLEALNPLQLQATTDIPPTRPSVPGQAGRPAGAVSDVVASTSDSVASDPDHPAPKPEQLYPMPRVGERFPSVDAVRVAGSYASHQLGYRLALYSHPLRRADGTFPPFQLVCNHARHLHAKTALCPALILCKGVDKDEWEVETVELNHNHPPKFGAPWKAPKAPGPKQRTAPGPPPPPIGSRSRPSEGVEGSQSPQKVPYKNQDIVAQDEDGDADADDGQPQYPTGDHNFGSDELLPIPAPGTIFPSRDDLQYAVFRAYHQRGYHVTVFQSPVPGTKRLLGLGCSRKTKPFCPFRLFAGPVDPNLSAAGFRLVEFSETHNHPARDQGEWIPRKTKGGKIKKRKMSGSRDGSPDDDGEGDGDGDETMEDAPSSSSAQYVPTPYIPKKVPRTSIAETSPAIVRANGNGNGSEHVTAAAFGSRPSPLSRFNAVASTSRPATSTPPLLYFNQPPPQASSRNQPPPPAPPAPQAPQASARPYEPTPPPQRALPLPPPPSFYGANPPSHTASHMPIHTTHTANQTANTPNQTAVHSHTANSHNHSGNSYSGNMHSGHSHSVNPHSHANGVPSGNSHSGNSHSGNSHSGNSYGGNSHTINQHSVNPASGNPHSHTNGVSSPYGQPLATAQAEWTTFLARLEPSLTYLASSLASPALGCTPALFFSSGTSDEMRMSLLERVEGIPLWPRMVLMEKVATSGAKVWSEMGVRA
ncbi:hypothetical protein RQP46_004217 [Phenoliferia psychrophenolica]